jgi:thioredoxin 1
MIPSLTAAAFDAALLASRLPVLVEVGAEWCPPCRALEPVLGDVAGERRGRLEVVRVDADQNPDVAARFGIMSVPTLLLFAAGELRGRWVGYRSKPRLLALVDAALGALPSTA